jgi:hypothetical protein
MLIGDEAKKRCRELFGKNDATAKFEVNCIIYDLERGPAFMAGRLMKH